MGASPVVEGSTTGGQVGMAPPDSEGVVGDSSVVLCQEALLQGDTLVSFQQTCQSFQCSGERCYQDEAHANRTTACHNETYCEVWRCRGAATGKAFSSFIFTTVCVYLPFPFSL